jgi:hypothetical protein
MRKGSQANRRAVPDLLEELQGTGAFNHDPGQSDQDDNAEKQDQPLPAAPRSEEWVIIRLPEVCVRKVREKTRLEDAPVMAAVKLVMGATHALFGAPDEKSTQHGTDLISKAVAEATAT